MPNMAKVTALVLCGGLGTRLRDINSELPKSMVPVAERPFLEYVCDYLLSQGVTKAIFAVSYKKEYIIEHFRYQYKNLDIAYSVESEPLGTGGAVKHAINQYSSNSNELFLILNGDTLMEYQLTDMLKKLHEQTTDLVMCLKYMEDTNRYGRVETRADKVTRFAEKQSGSSGLINAGVYLINTKLTQQFPQRASFSFEKDVLEKMVHSHCVMFTISTGYFIDIGVPKDYLKAQTDLSTLYEN